MKKESIYAGRYSRVTRVEMRSDSIERIGWVAAGDHQQKTGFGMVAPAGTGTIPGMYGVHA